MSEKLDIIRDYLRLNLARHIQIDERLYDFFDLEKVIFEFPSQKLEYLFGGHLINYFLQVRDIEYISNKCNFYLEIRCSNRTLNLIFYILKIYFQKNIFNFITYSRK